VRSPAGASPATAAASIAAGVTESIAAMTGQAPPRGRTYLLDGLALVSYESALTPLERSLVEHGHAEIVREGRRLLIDSEAAELCALVAGETRVVPAAMLADTSIDAGRSFVAFLADVEAPPASPDPGGRRRCLARSFVTLFKDLVGRGPQFAHANVCDDLVVVVLGETLTRQEQMLAQTSQGPDVRQLRRQLQELLADRAAAIVNDCIGRNVSGLMSDVSVIPDVTIEVLLLDPEG
jgi:uncharacterized protein YbcI